MENARSTKTTPHIKNHFQEEPITPLYRGFDPLMHCRDFHHIQNLRYIYIYILKAPRGLSKVTALKNVCLYY